MTGLDGWGRAARGDLPYEERSALFDALQDLPTMQRKVVVLRHWLGLPVEETTRELGISTGTVKSQTSRGIARLKEVLGDTFDTVAAQPAQEPPRQAASPERSA